jgi:hypothetical protein
MILYQSLSFETMSKEIRNKSKSLKLSIKEAESYLFQKPSMERQTCGQTYETIAPHGIPKCYDPILYRKAMEILKKNSKQNEV